MTSAMTPALTAAMTPIELRTLIDRYRAEGLVPPGPLVCSGGRAPGGSFNPFGIVADLVVDLKVSLDEADAAGLQALDIHADTVVVPEGFDRRLDGAVRRLTVVARRIVSEGTTVLRMLHDEGNELSRVRIFVEAVEGRFTLYGGPTRDTAYALEEAWDTVTRPRFSNFLWQDNRAVVKHTPVPPGLLEHGEPMHRVLAALFALSAGMAGRPGHSAAELALCHEALGWITRWSGVESGFGELIQAAGSLQRLLPVMGVDGLARPIPDLSAGSYLSLAKARQEVMAAMEAHLRSLRASGELAGAVGSVAQAFADRDTLDLKTLEARCTELEQRLIQQIDALDRAARTVRQEELEAELAAMRLKLESDVAQIVRTVKMSLEIAFGVIAVAGSVAALCVGVPPDPKALTETGQKGVLGLKDLYGQAKTLGGSIDGPLKALKALGQSFAIPLQWARHNSSTLKNLVDPAKGALNAVLPVIRGPLGGLDVEGISRELGDTMRALALMPDANEAKAAWTVLENDAVNRLDLVLATEGTEAAVRNAANTLKTQVQKVAVYGRLLAEQSASKNASARELATLKLEYVAVIGKRKRLQALEQQALTELERSARLQGEITLRAESARRGFFVDCFGVRAAQAYETGKQPGHRLSMPGTAAAMADAHATLLADHASAQAANARTQGDLRRELRVTDAALLQQLAHGQPISLSIATSHPALASYRRIRLSSVQAWLEFADASAQRINIDLVTGSDFHDSTGSGDERLFCSPLKINFTYAGDQIEFSQHLGDVCPTPFTTWLIEVLEPRQMPAAPRALRLLMAGTAAR
ncbi:hypothetical protein N5D66_07430 [Delftia tsuruhatensis]|uniref:hypothetical protein n=1 Tax=Delftia tsuruhatensis TaxID=180282 RepID=UPI00244D2AB8|nr:hypothetical protein [Delftia tsuruhatensis]MDH0847770.1 hypothetical protein [Delftia tsuruhatensis]